MIKSSGTNEILQEEVGNMTVARRMEFALEFLLNNRWSEKFGLIYGANYNIAKVVMPEFVEPFGLILIRITSTVAILWIIQLSFIRETMHRQDLIRFLL